MKTPPLLLGATLLFWGWQTGFPIAGAILGVLLEAARLFKTRWEFGNEDFQRIWTFCTLLLLASLVYAFTANEGPADFREFFQNPNFSTQREAGTASARTAASVIRWLPMVFFPFIAAQVYSTRGAIPLETISLILRLRWRKARKLGQPTPPSRTLDVSYLYFALCLVSASIQTAENSRFFWGLCVLVPWAFWPHRSRRYQFALWVAMVGLAIGLGYLAQRGVGELTRYLEGLNSQLFAYLGRRRFDFAQARTQIGRLGQLKNSARILLRLEVPPYHPIPHLLREASYRTYKDTFWIADTPRATFETIPSDTNQTTWQLVPGKPAASLVSIACSLRGGQGLLPLPTGTARLENLPAYGLQKSELGAVLAQGPGLVIFDACHAPGLTHDSPANTNQDLAVPPREAPALQEVVAKLGLTNTSYRAAREAIQGFFLDHFTYSTWQGPRPLSATNATPLADFLLRSRSGHCEYFATATVLLMRQLNIPARYAVGYAVHESPKPGKFVVRQRDAHAWCLVWNAQRGIWEDFDTTPASWVEAEKQRASAFQFLSDFWSRIGFEISKIRWGQTRLRQYLLWSLVPILLVLLYQIVFRRRRQGQSTAGSCDLLDWPGRDSDFYRLTRLLEKRGLTRQPGEPLAKWLRRVLSRPEVAELKPAIEHLLQLHYRYRFDPAGLSTAERAILRDEVNRCVTSLSGVKQRARQPTV